MKLKLITAIVFFCISIFTNKLLASPTATISGTTTICKDAAHPEITLTGANGVAPYTFSYAINGVMQPTIETVSGNAMTIPISTATAGTLIFTLISVADANNASQSQTGSATITINALPTATSTIISTCSYANDFGSVDLTSVQNTVNNVSGNTFAWFSDADLMTPILTPNSHIAPVYNTTVVYVSVTNITSSCTNSTNVSVTLAGPTPDGLSVGGSICVGQTAQVFGFPGGTWHSSLPHIATIDINTGLITAISDGLTTISHNVINSGMCLTPAPLEVIINALPTATISGTTTVGRNTTNPTVTFNGIIGQPPFKLTYNINGGAEQTCMTNLFYPVGGPLQHIATLSQSTTTLGSFVYNLVKAEDVTGCSQVQTGSATITVSSSLSSELNTFTAHPLSKNIELTWQTASEKNNDHFDIERSTDGKTFNPIGQVKAKGNSSTLQDYAFLDETPTNGMNYYRLRQLDIDGTATLSYIVSVAFRSNQKLRVFPSPAKDKLTILSDSKNDYTIFDMVGHETLKGMLSESQTEVDVSTLPVGMYVLRVQNSITKFIKE